MMCDGGAGEWREEKFQVVNNMAGRQNGTKNSGKSIIWREERTTARRLHPPCAMLIALLMLHAQYYQINTNVTMWNRMR